MFFARSFISFEEDEEDEEMYNEDNEDIPTPLRTNKQRFCLRWKSLGSWVSE